MPLCGGVPPDSSTCATIVAVPLTGSAFVAVVNVIVEPVGASSGTFSQPAAKSGAAQSTKSDQNAGQRDVLSSKP